MWTIIRSIEKTILKWLAKNLWNKTVDKENLYILLLPHHAKTTDQILMKLGIVVTYIKNQHIEYLNQNRNVNNASKIASETAGRS